MFVSAKEEEEEENTKKQHTHTHPHPPPHTHTQNKTKQNKGTATFINRILCTDSKVSDGSIAVGAGIYYFFEMETAVSCHEFWIVRCRILKVPIVDWSKVKKKILKLT